MYTYKHCILADEMSKDTFRHFKVMHQERPRKLFENEEGTERSFIDLMIHPNKDIYTTTASGDNFDNLVKLGYNVGTKETLENVFLKVI